jgi:hypothetical protein
MEIDCGLLSKSFAARHFPAKTAAPQLLESPLKIISPLFST